MPVNCKLSLAIVIAVTLSTPFLAQGAPKTPDKETKHKIVKSKAKDIKDIKDSKRKGKDALSAKPSIKAPLAKSTSATVAVPADMSKVDTTAVSDPQPNTTSVNAVVAKVEIEPVLPPRLEEGLAVVNGIKPDFTRALTDELRQPGRNHSNPYWSPNGAQLGLESNDERNKEILIADTNGSVLQTVAYKAADDGLGLDLLLPELAGSSKYSSEISWASDGKRFVYSGNGADGNYDLFLGELGVDVAVRLTDHPEKDAQPSWSPREDKILFVSGRGGNAGIYALDLASKAVQPLVQGDKSAYYPLWSPDGQQFAYTYGGNQNHDIVVMSFTTGTKQIISNWPQDDLRPVWSPDGTQLAFYTNFNTSGDEMNRAIVVVNASTNTPYTSQQLIDSIVAQDVMADVQRGPAWTPDSKHIVYSKKEGANFNPIYVVNVTTKQSTLVATNTNINHDLTVSSTGMLAFRAQVERWDQVFVSKIKLGDGL